MVRRAVGIALLVVATLAVGACGGGGSSSDGAEEKPLTKADEQDARARVRDFLDLASNPEVTPLCEMLSTDFLNRLSPAGGNCLQALTTLTALLQPNVEAFTTKVVDRSVMQDDRVVVVLDDGVTGENEVAVRLVHERGDWYIDEIGPGAQLTLACIEEEQLVVHAVDEWLSDHADYPPDAKALVPSKLDKVPDNHDVHPDGSVTPKGVCKDH